MIASWSVTNPTAAPVSASDHHGFHTSHSPICSTPSAPPSQSPELTTKRRSSSPQRSKSSTSTRVSDAMPRTTIERRSKAASTSACTARTIDATSARPSMRTVALNAPPSVDGARAAQPYPMSSATSRPRSVYHASGRPFAMSRGRSRWKTSLTLISR